MGERKIGRETEDGERERETATEREKDRGERKIKEDMSGSRGGRRQGWEREKMGRATGAGERKRERQG